MTIQLLHGAQVFNPSTASVERADVSIVDGKIADSARGHDQAAATTAMDLRGMTILPGLINVHTHLEQRRTWGSVVDQLKLKDVFLAIRGVSASLRSLQEGVTTLRDLGAKHHLNIDLKRAIDAQLIPGPRVLAAGSFISITGGHLSTISTEADSPIGMQIAVRETIKAGADVIKLVASTDPVEKMASGEYSRPDFMQDEIAAAVETAHMSGRRVACHAISRQSIEWALKAGVDSIEHGIYLDAKLAEHMAKEGIALVPTLSAYHQATLSSWGRGVDTLGMRTKLVKPQHEAAVSLAIAAGVRIAMGTDTNGDIVEELEMLVRCGMTPAQALRTATLDAAQVIGLEDSIGSLEPGKIADLIVVRGNPLEDLKALREIEWVFQAGSGRRPSEIVIPTGDETEANNSLRLRTA